MSHVSMGVLAKRFTVGASSCAKHTSLAAALPGLADVAHDLCEAKGTR